MCSPPVNGRVLGTASSRFRLYSPATSRRFPGALSIRDLLTIDKEWSQDVGASRGFEIVVVVVVGGFLDAAFHDVEEACALRIAVRHRVHRFLVRSRFLEILHEDGYNEQRRTVDGRHFEGQRVGAADEQQREDDDFGSRLKKKKKK